ncbi:MAG: hypothetical protein OEY56_01880 [Cyclobacteriaceae bacterium]|nr:hypothetical protein [Cyclobacteriaceae bacterium]
MKITIAGRGLIVALALSCLVSCNDHDVPEIPNEEEIVTDVILSFLAEGSVVPVTALAQDPDGEGSQGLVVVSHPVLVPNTTYTLSIEVKNSLANTNITDEIVAEGHEHMFFFAFADGLFSNPAGVGNVADRTQPVVYKDTDSQGLPVGLLTSWVTGSGGSGAFRVLLKHQPGIKSATSTSVDGESDIDITWTLDVQ